MRERYVLLILLVIGLLAGPGITFDKYTQYSQDKQRYGQISDIDNRSPADIRRYYTNEIIDTGGSRLASVFADGALYVLVRQAPAIYQTLTYHQYFVLKFAFSSDFSKILSFEKLSTPFNTTANLQGLDKVGDSFYTVQSTWNHTLKYPVQRLIQFTTTGIQRNRTIPVPDVDHLEFSWISREFFQIDHGSLYTLERYYHPLNNIDENIFSRVVKYDATTMQVVSMTNLTIQYARSFRIEQNKLWLWYQRLPYEGISYYNSRNQTISSGFYAYNLDELFQSNAQGVTQATPQQSVFIHNDLLVNYSPYEEHGGQVLEQHSFAPLLINGYIIYAFAYYRGDYRYEFNSFQVLRPLPRHFGYGFSLPEWGLTLSGYILMVFVVRKLYVTYREKGRDSERNQ